MNKKLNVVIGYGNVNFILYTLIDTFMSLKMGVNPWQSLIVVGVVYIIAIALMYYQKAMAIYLHAFTMFLVLVTDIAAIYQVLNHNVMNTFFEKGLILVISILNLILLVFWAKAAYEYRKEQGIYHKQ